MKVLINFNDKIVTGKYRHLMVASKGNKVRMVLVMDVDKSSIDILKDCFKNENTRIPVTDELSSLEAESRDFLSAIFG